MPGWGKVMIGVRLEKMVESEFVLSWSQLLSRGMRSGDAWEMTLGMPPHIASNTIVRRFLKSSCDSLLFLDSDARVDADFLSNFRDYEPGWEYDILQAFYVRRGWPPNAIWLQRDSQGVLRQSLVLGDATEPVDIVGTHAALMRRHVFEKMLGDNDPETFDWFFYPRHSLASEDGAFSEEAIRFGFKLGATTAVRADHIVHLPIGWEAYQDYLHSSGQVDAVQLWYHLVDLLSQYTHETPDEIRRKCSQGSLLVRQAWERKSPQTSRAIREFYQTTPEILYDLALWNGTPLYTMILRSLQEIQGGSVLVVGAGLGNEVEVLRRGNAVTVFELPGVLKDFLLHRFQNQDVVFLEGESLTQAIQSLPEIPKYSAIVMIDVLEHVPPEEVHEFLECLWEIWSEGGVLVSHNNFRDQSMYPMHFDHSRVFEQWVSDHQLTQTSEISWIRR